MNPKKKDVTKNIAITENKLWLCKNSWLNISVRSSMFTIIPFIIKIAITDKTVFKLNELIMVLRKSFLSPIRYTSIMLAKRVK